MHLTRRAVSLLLGGASIGAMAGCATTPAVSEADAGFSALSARWLEGVLRLTPVEATKIGEHRYDGEVDDLSAAGRGALLAFTREIAAELEAIDKTALSREAQVDAALLDNQLKSQIWTIERQRAHEWNTLFYQNKAGDAIYALMARDFAPLPQRLMSLTARLQKIPNLLAQARSELVIARVSPPYAATYAAQNPGLKSLIGELVTPNLGALSGPERSALEQAIAAFNEAVDSHQNWIEAALVPNAHGEWRVGAELYDEQLALTLLTPLTRQEIRARAEAAVIDVRARMYEASKAALAGRAGAPPTPDQPSPAQQQAVIAAALALSGAERPTRENLVADATAGVQEAQVFVRAHDLIALPPQDVRVIVMPEFQQGVAVAYCDSPGPLERDLATYYAVSPIPAAWTDEQAASFLREYNSRAIVDVGVHEAMPGHYVQLWHANAYPSTLRAVLYSGSFVEGWACYAEDMMVEQGFRAGDPLYKLAQLKVLLRTVTNSILDQMLQVDGASEAEAMRFLTETAFQEEREAAGKFRRGQLSSTQLATYFVGYTEHKETRAAAEARPGFSLKAYHDDILSFGSPPMRFARALLLDEPII